MSESRITKVSLTIALGCLVLLWFSNFNLDNETPVADKAFELNETQTALVIDSATDKNAGGSLLAYFAQLMTSPFKAIYALWFGNAVIPESYGLLPSDFDEAAINPNDFLSMIVINTNPANRVVCNDGRIPYEFFVIFPDNSNILEGACGGGGDYLDYALEISQYLKNTKGLPVFDRTALEQIPIIVGDGSEALTQTTAETF